MMKGSMIVCLFFLLGCLIGFGVHIQLDTHNLSMYILYVLMFQVGINIGSNENLKGMLAHFTPKMLIIPLGTIVGTLLFSALASLLLSQWSVFDCMAVGSGFAYYSLSSILITQFKEPSLGLQLATELGITRNQMSRIENGRANCTIQQLYIMSQIFEHSMDYIISGKRGRQENKITFAQREAIDKMLRAFDK